MEIKEDEVKKKKKEKREGDNNIYLKNLTT